MRKLLNFLKAHLRKDFHPGLYLTISIFLAITISANYYFDIENTVIDAYRGREIRILWYFLLYSFAYYFTVLTQAFFSPQGNSVLRQPRFWVLSLAGMGMLGVDGAFHYHQWVAEHYIPVEAQYYAMQCLSQLNSLFTILLPCALLYWLYDRPENFYGMTTHQVDWRPYGGMLLVMMPLITWASFQPDFLSSYPSYHVSSADRYLPSPPWLNALGFELAYGWDFVATELLFRGFLVIGMVNVLGSKAVLPMAVTYAFLHFGKPVGETIGSIFGGYILGVIALYTRNIWGGVAIHLGIAWLMELAAFIQIEFRS
ncbi:MAG: CPBP family intramembrane glutamic endopeptidase [Bacteroidota bacterium]